jgi:hypothetical protein
MSILIFYVLHSFIFLYFLLHKLCNECMNDDFLSIKDFAILVHMHYNTIYKFVKNGRIQAFRLRSAEKGSFRIPRSETNRIAEMNLRIKLEE